MVSLVGSTRTGSCPLCDAPDCQGQLLSAELEQWKMTCLGCGRYFLNQLLPNAWPQQNKIELGDFPRRRFLLAGIAASQSIRHLAPVTFTPENWVALASQAPQFFPEQMDQFLVNLAHKSSEPGVATSLGTAIHRSLAFASSADSFVARVETLEQEGWAKVGGGRSGNGYNDMHFRLTLAGWQRARAMMAKVSHSRVGFVAMPFASSSLPTDHFQGLLDKGLRPGIQLAGYTPKRIDDDPHAEKIDHRILNEIRDARFVVVDTTDSNPNVLFEAGYALGLGKSIIWTCHRDHVEALRFDFRQYNHLPWDGENWPAFADRLCQAIKFNLGEVGG